MKVIFAIRAEAPRRRGRGAHLKLEKGAGQRQ
jgi:hypothetical protein